MVFEGFMDFLSYLTIINSDIPDYDVLVLNSTINLQTSLPKINSYKKVFCFFDNDPTGKKAQAEINGNCQNSKIIDCSSKYQNLNDLNDWLCKSNN
jgi:5S rRNA maturation endonuclease (ribonuclease M5)